MRVVDGARTYTPPIVSDLSLLLDPALSGWIDRAFDLEGKVVRGLEELGPIADRDVIVVGGLPGIVDRIENAGARIVRVSPDDPAERAEPAERAVADVVLGAWSAFRGVDAIEIDEAVGRLRPGGRLLVVHDYGRDDIARLAGERQESVSWSRRDGPFTAAGFRIRVVHCWWTFTSVDEAGSFLRDAFGEAGAAFGATLRRPRLSHNVAIYHRGAEPD